jgi:hypothetical protein
MATFRATANRHGSQLAAGIGLLLPRSYYERKLALQQLRWRSNPNTLCNVRVIQASTPEPKVYKEQAQAIRVQSPHDQDPEGGVLLFDSRVSTGFSVLRTGPWVGPFYSTLEDGYIKARHHGQPVVPREFHLHSQQRAEFFRRLGLKEDEVVSGQALGDWYGFWLQQVA